MDASASSRRVLMVCAGSATHGLGHVMRARTVASALARHVAVQVVALGDPAVLTPLLRGRGVPFTVNADPADAADICRDWNPQVVAFDTTTFPEPHLLDMKRGRLVAGLSPAFDCQHLVDVLFHRTRVLTPELERFTGDLRSGLKYVVLRETCQRIPDDTFERSLDRGPLAVAISMGGVDAGNNTLKLLSSIATLPIPLLLWVSLGEGYAHSYHSLVERVETNPRHEVILARTTDSLWRVLETCSVAVLAGGITTYEAAFAGLPSINVLQNDRGPALVRELIDEGVALAAGPPFDAALAAVNDHLLRLDRERYALLDMHRRGGGLIDDLGAERIAQEITALCG